MLDESGKPIGQYPPEPPQPRKTRRKRVQSRGLPVRDIWDPSKGDLPPSRMDRFKRRRKTSTIAWLGQVFICLALGLAIPSGAMWLGSGPWKNLRQQPLRSITIKNAFPIYTDQFLLDQSGMKMGKNLRDASADEAKAKLEGLPGVKSARVEILWPDAARIEVESRTPLAWLSCPEHGMEPLRSHGYFIDESAVPFPCEKMEERFTLLPTIEVRGLPLPVPGTRWESEWVRESIKLVRASEALFGGLGITLIDIRPLGDWGLLCHYSGNLMVTFSSSRLEGGLRDLFVLLNEARRRNLYPASVNVGPSKNVPVIFRDLADSPIWENIAETDGKNHVIEWDDNREKRLRAIFDNSL